MAKTILVAGYTKKKNVEEIRSFFPNETVIMVCAYARKPLSATKQEYLTLFDGTYDLTNEDDCKKLSADSASIDCVTCSQERDMVAYIKSLLLCGKITSEQSVLYTTAINKHTFKESIEKTNPELVPSHHVVTPKLLENLDALTYPQVIKPSGLAGSTMIRVVHSAKEFSEHYQNFAGKMQEIANEHYSKDVEILTESFVQGPQYSVNAYIHASGNIVFAPAVRVVTPQEMGINDTYSVFQYTTDELTPAEITSLEAAVTTIVKHFSILDTSAHFDAVLDNGQWKFFEVGLRYGGHRQKLYEFSHHMNTLKNDILNRLGHTILIPEQKKNVCILQKCVTHSGTLKSISYTRTITEEKMPLVIESKLAKVGSEVMPLSLGGGTITRHFIVGMELVDVLATSRELFDAIQLELSN